jgi:tetratricopeptide (TPR) repeat protein
MDFIYPNVRNDAFNNIGVAYSRLNKIDEAIQSFSEALRFIRTLPDVREVRQLGNYTRRNRAKAYIAAKQYANALNDYDTMAAKEPFPKHQALRCLAHALYDDAYASALADCQKAIAADKNAGDAYTGWLVVEYRQGKYADVKSDCALAEDKGWLPPDSQYVCGLADLRLGNTKRGNNYTNLARDLGMEHSDRFRELGMVP